MSQNLYEGEGASKQNHQKSAKKKRRQINMAGKRSRAHSARNWSSVSMGGYTGLGRGWTLDRGSQGRRPSFGHQIGGSDGGDPTLMLLSTFFLLISGLGSKHLRGRTAAIGGRIWPSRRRAGSSTAGNRRRPRRSGGPRKWRVIGRSIGRGRRTGSRGRRGWGGHGHRRPRPQGGRGQARCRCERRGWRTFDAG